MPASVSELAYDLSRDALREQERRLGDLRSRAGTLLAAASIAGSFLAAQHGSLDAATVLAVLAYVCCAGSAVFVLLPHTLTLEFRGSIVSDLARSLGTSDVERAMEGVTEWLEDFHEDNRGKLDTLGRWYAASCGFLGVEVLLWTLTLTGSL